MTKNRITAVIALTVLLAALVLPGATTAAKADTTAPTIEKPVHVTVVDELGNPVDGATVEVRNDNGETVKEAVSVDGTLSVFLPAGDYTVQGTAAPDGYIPTDETQGFNVALLEAEERDNILGNTVKDHDHPEFCSKASHVGLELYSVYDGEETVTAYCFNQNYDNPYDYEGYKRLVGTPELLFDLAQNKSDSITAQELYDHVLAIIYHRDEMKEKYGLDEAVTRYLTNMCLKSYTDPKCFYTFDDEGNSTLIRDEQGRPVLDEDGHYQYNGNGTVLGSILNHSKVDNKTITVPQEFIDAFKELREVTDHPSDYYLYIYYPANFEKGNTDTYQCLMSTFEVSPVRVQLVVRQATDVSITKVWDDGDDRDGLRPTADEFAQMITLTANGEDVTADHADQLTVTDNGDNTYTVTYAGLPKTDEGQESIEYVIHETEVPGYDADKTGAGDGETITNTHEPELTEITVSKVWDDADDADGLRPGSITIHLLADGQEFLDATVTPDEDGNWSYTFTGLYVYENGEEIEYTVTEDPVEGYDTDVDEFGITNTHEPELTEITVNKVWDDADDFDGFRPDSITIHLLADGEVVQTVEIAPDEDGNWSYTFTGLLKNSKGEEIEYTVTEEPVEGYETEIEGFEITNIHEPVLTDVTVTKIWEDGDDREGLRPESITVHLFANGEEIDSAAIEADENGDWSHTFTDLPMYRDGKEIEYTVTEDVVEGYEAEIEGLVIRNRYVPQTGDGSHAARWASLTALSALGAAFLRKRREEED